MSTPDTRPHEDRIIEALQRQADILESIDYHLARIDASNVAIVRYLVHRFRMPRRLRQRIEAAKAAEAIEQVNDE